MVGPNPKYVVVLNPTTGIEEIHIAPGHWTHDDALGCSGLTPADIVSAGQFQVCIREDSLGTHPGVACFGRSTTFGKDARPKEDQFLLESFLNIEHPPDQQ